MTGQDGNKALFWLFATPKNLLFLGLACPQVWLTFMFETLDSYAPQSVEIFYTARGLTMALVAVISLIARFQRSQAAEFLAWPLAVVMSLSPSFRLCPLLVWSCVARHVAIMRKQEQDWLQNLKRIV